MPDGTAWPTAPSSAVRRPRARILANGTALKGLYECSVQDNNALKAAKWDAHLALNADPTFDWGQKDITVSVDMMFLPDGAAEGTDGPWTTLLSGKIDDLHLDPVNGAVHLSGRDLTGVLIDTKVQAAYPNKTTSEILSGIAAAHGWTADVTATTQPVGAYYKAEHDKLALGNFSKQTTEWDLACYLVRQEGQDIWIDMQGGTPTLHTRPASDPDTTSSRFPLLFVPPGSVQGAAWPTLNVASDIQLERSLTIAKDVRVTVKTWNAKAKGSHTVTVDGKGSEVAKGKGEAGPGTPQTHVFVKPNLTPDAALRFAQQQAKILTQLERIVTVRMPGELSLTPRDIVALSGLTGGATSWNQSYFVDTLNRKLSWEAGFEQDFRLKNSSPRTETTES